MRRTLRAHRTPSMLRRSHRRAYRWPGSGPALAVLLLALFAGACGSDNAPRGFVVDAVTPAVADAGETVVLSGRLPGGGAVHACERPLEGLAVASDPDADPFDGAAWVSAGDATPNRGYPLARAVAPAALRGETCVLTLVDADGVHHEPDLGEDGGPPVAAPSLAVRATVPAAIGSVSVTDGDAHAVVTFVPPDPRGRPILRYEVRVSPSDAWRTPSPSDAVPFVVDGLTNGVTYTDAHVRAVNAVGPGPDGEPFVLAPFAPADPPVDVVATPGDGIVTLDFELPNDNGRTITHVQIRIDDGPWTDVPLEEAGSQLVVGGLTNGEAYDVGVRVVTGAGPGEATWVRGVTPVAPPAPSTPVRVGAGYFHSFAVDPGGRTWAWGENGHNELGDGTDMDRTAPVPIATLPVGVWTDAGGGLHHSHLLDAEGRVWSWGDNVDGQLGTGNVGVDQATPVSLTDAFPHAVRAVDSGVVNGVAADVEGGLWVWGTGNLVTFGARRGVPERVVVLSHVDVRSVAVADEHALVAGAEGGVWAWGTNLDGRVGNGTTTDVSAPVSLSDAFPRPVTAVAAGARHSLALDEAGDVWAWGSGAEGRLGIGAGAQDALVPVRVEGFGGRRIVAIDAGRAFSVALDAEGDVWAWGRGVEGQLGTGDTADAAVPQRVVGLPHPVLRVAAGAEHALAADATDAVWGWGANDRGQVGGDADVHASPVRVLLR